MLHCHIEKGHWNIDFLNFSKNQFFNGQNLLKRRKLDNFFYEYLEINK